MQNTKLIIALIILCLGNSAAQAIETRKLIGVGANEFVVTLRECPSDKSPWRDCRRVSGSVRAVYDRDTGGDERTEQMKFSKSAHLPATILPDPGTGAPVNLRSIVVSGTERAGESEIFDIQSAGQFQNSQATIYLRATNFLDRLSSRPGRIEIVADRFSNEDATTVMRSLIEYAQSREERPFRMLLSSDLNERYAGPRNLEILYNWLAQDFPCAIQPHFTQSNQDYSTRQGQRVVLHGQAVGKRAHIMTVECRADGYNSGSDENDLTTALEDCEVTELPDAPAPLNAQAQEASPAR